ncbi:MAG: GTPase ObgE [Lachnospiraceae bacterium]|nr:GTPase ObgE [Lachnospiraceae bacterium]
MFSDKVKIIIRSGKGGDGHVSFRREKYVPAGGPDGGDGGKGGDVWFYADNNENTLGSYRRMRKYKAEDGCEGQGARKSGKAGKDLILKVPEGTLIKDSASGKIIADMSGDNKKFLILKGGRGGSGNMHFATSTMQAPRYAKPGGDARELEVELELKLIADCALAGFPSAGKSSIISKVSNARPEVAAYHFTTLTPHLGVVRVDEDNSFVMADIPGLIEGAADGAGLGHEFLRHIQRTKVLVNVVDASGLEGRDPVDDVKRINEELELFDPGLIGKPMIIAANKIDILPPESDSISRLKEAYEPEMTVYPVSAVTGEGMQALIYGISQILSELPADDIVYEQEFDPETELNPDNSSFKVYFDNKEGVYCVDGPLVEKMLGYTNLESEKGFMFFQKFIKEKGIREALIDAGVADGDTVRIYGYDFEYISDIDEEDPDGI